MLFVASLTFEKCRPKINGPYFLFVQIKTNWNIFIYLFILFFYLFFENKFCFVFKKEKVLGLGTRLRYLFRVVMDGRVTRLPPGHDFTIEAAIRELTIIQWCKSGREMFNDIFKIRCPSSHLTSAVNLTSALESR